MTVLLTSEPLVELLESPRLIDARYGVFFKLHPASIPSMLTGVKGIAISANYASTQILGESFKREGLDGILYRTGLGTGFNVALFNLDDADPINCTLYSVKAVSFTFDRSGDTWYSASHYKIGKDA